MRRRRRSRSGLAVLLFLVGALTGVLALLLHGFVDVNLQIPANGLHFVVLVGLCLAVARAQDARARLVVIDGAAPADAPEEEDMR